MVLCPLTIGISAVVYFFALTGNFPCKYNNQFMLAGERKVMMYKGTPAKCFFQCVDLVILMQIV